MPKVSLGLPVYNGEEFVGHAIDSLLNQTYEDFEIIICDNASTDATQAICQAAAEKDSRIQYHRNETNLGAAPNFNRTFDLSSGAYFKWVAHDDLLEPRYLEECVKVLDTQSDVAACHSFTAIIDENGTKVCPYTLEDGEFDHQDPVKRYVAGIRDRHFCISIFALIRRSALEHTDKIGSYVGSDRNLIAEIALQGRIVHVPKVLFLSRDHQSRSTRAMRLEERGEWFDVSQPDPGTRYVLTNLRENFRILFRNQLTLPQRLRAIVLLTAWAGKRSGKIARELTS
ncbi:MAG: glycosyltransferase family 2 protein [Pseudomonadota bacterium]